MSIDGRQGVDSLGFGILSSVERWKKARLQLGHGLRIANNYAHKFCLCVALTVVVLNLYLRASRADPTTAAMQSKQSRTEFAKQMAKVDVRMTKSQVTQLIGNPDAVRAEFGNYRWCYGVGTEFGFPTLGSVIFDEHGRVLYILGLTGTPPDDRRISESKLRHLIDMIGGLSGEALGPTSQWYDPARYISVANTFISEGRENALVVIDEFIRVSDNDTGFLGNADLLMRILFDPPVGRGFLPVAPVQSPFGNPVNLNTIPRFPIVLIDDVPILGVTASYGGGFYNGNDKRVFLANIHDHAKMRTTLLKPPANPLDLFDKLAASDQWYWSDNCEKTNQWRRYSDFVDAGRQDAMHQLLRLVCHVYPSANRYLAARDDVYPISRSISDDEWRQCCREVAALKLRWNPGISQYQSDLSSALLQEHVAGLMKGGVVATR